ncbi:13402_t:CDS:2 [Gigaspora margarita]|uniref:13402_t:CDS:1 n=1 Tax=Gigaspora margarita TaxID=4874 RepID=A0ABN7UGG9_GIGMA|nr:13402_t:CDS:2 [Gigaspora margarita]
MTEAVFSSKNEIAINRKSLLNMLEEKDSKVVKSLWAGIFSNTGGLDFYNLIKKIDNELEINRINLQDPYADKLAFNHPLLSGVIDLDIIDEVMLKIFSFDELKEMTEKPQNIPIPDSLYHEKCTYILDMYLQLGTRTPEEGNRRVERNYNKMFFKISKNAKKMYQDKFQSRNKPDWLEGNQRKVIRFLLHCIESINQTLKKHFSSPIDGDLVESAKCIPRFGMLLYGMV